MNILIIRVSAIGDVIHTLPAVFLLKYHFPQANISWVVQKKAAHLLVDQPYLNHVFVLPDKYLHPTQLQHTIKTLAQLHKINWDAIIDFQGLLKTATLLMPLTGKKFGFSARHARERISTWFTHYHDTPTYTNIVQKNLSLASTVALELGATTSSPSPRELQSTFALVTQPEKQQQVDSWLTENHLKNYVLLCPNTTWPSKHWPTDHWCTLISLINTARLPITPILVGTTFGDAAKAIAATSATKIHSCPAWDLITMTHLIKQAQFLVAPDTGLLHLADFLGTTAIGIFGPTSKEKHGPFWSTLNKTACLQVHCPHTYQKTHGNNPNLNCMARLTPEQVFHHLVHLFETKITQRQAP